MPGAHFLREDSVSTLLGIALFSLFAVPPGYLLGWLTGLLDFRRQGLAWRLVISVPVSVSAVPILAFWLDKIGGHAAVWIAFGVCWTVFAGLLVADARRGEIRVHVSAPSRITIAFILLAMAWAVIAFGSLVDLPIGTDRLYTSVTSSDQSYRTALTDAITRTGIVHPVNPLGYVDGPAPLRYHYFWFILSSLTDQAGGAWVAARPAFLASVIWCGMALACAIAIYLRFLTTGGETIAPTWILKAILLLAVTGLDIIPTFALTYFHDTRFMDMEAWNEAVTSWLGSLLWAPHSIGALVAGVTAFLILFHAPGLTRSRDRWASAALAGVLLATMLGDSIYVGLVVAVFLSVWTVITFFAGWRSHTALLVLAGFVTVALALPYLLSLTAAGGGGSFLLATVRDFRGAQAFGLPIEFPKPWETYLLRLALLPLNYLLELGFFLVAGILYLARLWHLRRIEPGQVAAIIMASTSILICTFLKSGVITNNDLGWRGFLPAQFILLLWAVELFRSWDQKWTASSRLYAILSPTLPFLIAMGILSTAYSAVTLRVVEILNDREGEHLIGKKNFAARQVYEQLRTMIPSTAIVQQNPALENPVYWGLYSNRQTAAAGGGCGIEFGGTARDCAQLYPALAAIFESGAQADQVEPLCRRLKIDVLVVTAGDGVWKIPDSWVWKRTPLISTAGARAFLIQSAGIADGIGDGSRKL